jgi:3-methyladenine DNA glycosylase AlkD
MSSLIPFWLKRKVDYVIHHLAEANFDPDYIHPWEIQNNSLPIRWCKNNIHVNQLKYIDRLLRNMQMDGIQKLGITLGLLGLFIMTLALLNV